MEKKILDVIKEQSIVLLQAKTSCEDAKKAAQAWLDAIGTKQEAAQGKAYVAALKDVIVTVDELLAFAESDAGKQHFGEESAKEITIHARQLKHERATYCDCPACAAVEKILQHEDALQKWI